VRVFSAAADRRCLSVVADVAVTVHHCSLLGLSNPPTCRVNPGHAQVEPPTW
jgi:hypothetical protein